jgi:hypothetical protein
MDRSNEHDSSSSNSSESSGRAYREGRNLHVGGHRRDENRYVGGHRGDGNQAADVHREAQNGRAHLNDILNVGKFMSDCQVREILKSTFDRIDDFQKVPGADSPSPILNEKSISSAETFFR